MNSSPFRPFILGVCLVLTAAATPATDHYAPDLPEPGSVEEIERLTSDPRFVNPWVAYIPEAEGVPSPTDYLGRLVGAAGELSRTAQIHGYFRALARASDRVQVEILGTTEEGREMLLAAVADEDGIRHLEKLKEATAALADPRRTDPGRAERILADARPIYYLNAGLHGDETGSPEMVMELAYRLAVSEQPMIRGIRERLVVLVNPVSNPDGRDKMVDWYYRYLKNRADYDSLPRQSPPYWGRYVFVDANRDAHQQTQELTRAVYKMFFDYHPTVVHDLHEAIALLQTWNGTGPYNPNLDPIVTSEFLEMSFHEVTTMTALGMPGVWTWNFGEGYGFHYLDSIAMNHNSIGRGYETFGNSTAETVERVIGPGETTRKWYRPWPPDSRFVWSMRDNVNYSQTACLAILDYTARHATEMLRNFYRKGYKSWQRGVAGDPHAFVIPPGQGDDRRVAQMVGVLLRQGIEVGRAAAPFTVTEGSFPRGSYIVRLDQPYRNYAVDLLEPQRFPPDAEHEPYDDISWALPVHYGVETARVDDGRVLEVELEALPGEERPAGRVTGDAGSVFLLADSGQEALLAARARLASFTVEIVERPFLIGDSEYPAGSWILPPQEGLLAALEGVAAELSLEFRGVESMPEVARHPSTLPRLGVWVPWADTDSIGWLRYTFDQQGIPYTYLRDEDLRRGRLRTSVDVLLYGNVDLDLQGQIHGIEPKTGPMAFTKTPEFPSHGVPAASEDITGGIGWVGMENLRRFVEDGGVLMTLGDGSRLPLEAGLVRNVRRTSDTGISTPGAELAVSFLQPDHPLAYGYPRGTSVFRSNFPVYDLPRRWLRMAYCTSCLDGPVDRRWVVMVWSREESQTAPAGGDRSMVVSGGGRGLESLAGKPAILAVPSGEGVFVVYNFNPMHRDLNHSDYRLLWNGILNWEQLAPSDGAS
jgi:hypothetical protein